MQARTLEADTLELRVLSGLQSGAALPLEDALAVGADDDADLLLLGDGGGPARLLVRLDPGGGLMLDTPEAGVVLADGRTLAEGASTPLQPGEGFRTGDVWLTVRASSDAWDAWTPPTMDAASKATTGASSQDGDEAHVAAAAPVMVADVRPFRKGRSARLPAAPRRMRAVGSVIVAAGLLSTMLGVAALVRQAAEAETLAGREVGKRETGVASNGMARAMSPARAASSTAVSAPAAAAAASAASASVTPQPPAAVITSADPQAVQREAAAAAPRAPAVEVNRGATSDRSGGHDRLLVNVPGDGIVILPFDIQEVLLGSHSQVTLTDGRRLEPGDRAGDWRLAEIRPGALVFDGPRKVQVGW